jgi:excisionase family DNA binding protein
METTIVASQPTAVAKPPRRRAVRKTFIPTGEPMYVRVAEAAHVLSISRSSVYVLMDRGDLAYAKFGKSRRVPKAALEEYQRKCLVGVAVSE